MTARRPVARPLAAALLGLAAALAGGGTPAQAADGGRWSVFPAPAGRAADLTSTGSARQFFYLEGEPGTMLKDRVSVCNLSTRPMRFEVSGTGTYRQGVGSWVRLARDRLTVPPRTRADIPFTVTVPGDAAPGEHRGSIVARAGGGRRAVGARIYLRVGGPDLPAFSVEHVTLDRGGSAAKVRYTLVNRGNVTLRPRLAVAATGVFGRTLLERRARSLPVELPPGRRVELTEPWAGAPRLDRVSLRLTVTAAGSDLRETGRASFLFLAVPGSAVPALLLGIGGPAAWCLRYLLRRRTRRSGAA